MLNKKENTKLKIYITEYFKKKYLSKIKWFNILKFIEKLKTYDFINLKYPYMKFKFNLLSISYRWVILKTKKWNIIAIILCLKKDKNCWDNIIWNKFEEKILFEQSKNLKDIKYGKYEMYEEYIFIFY
jgi:hypothetical protein